MKMLETRIAALALALTLNPSPGWERDSNLAPLLLFWEKGLGDEGRLS
jgi:hypothetical protein